MDRPQWTSLSFHVKKPCASAELERSPPPYASPPWPLSLVTNSEEQIGPTNPRLPALQREKKNTKNSDSGSCCRQNFFLSFFFPYRRKHETYWVASDVACSKNTPRKIQHKKPYQQSIAVAAESYGSSATTVGDAGQVAVARRSPPGRDAGWIPHSGPPGIAARAVAP